MDTRQSLHYLGDSQGMDIFAQRTQFASFEKGKGKHSKFNPFDFTEQGVAMLASILNSPKATQVNIYIVRAFVFIRQYALSHKGLTEKLALLETKYNRQFKDIYEKLDYLLTKDKKEIKQKERRRGGFKSLGLFNGQSIY